MEPAGSQSAHIHRETRSNIRKQKKMRRGKTRVADGGDQHHGLLDAGRMAGAGRVGDASEPAGGGTRQVSE